MKFRKISAVFFWFFVALVTSAQAVVTISPTHIRAGQSVFLDFSGVPAISLGAVDVPIPPGGSIDVQVYDYQFQTWQSVLANGSTQGSFEAYGCSASSFISCSPDIGTLTNTVKLTYDQPGLYSIDYSILKLAGWYGVYSTFDANGEMVDSGFGGPYSQISESGTFQITVAPVPEPSTWAMLLIGFAGIVFAARRSAVFAR